MARSAGVEHAVHQDVRPLPDDNGERFYGDYYLELVEREKTVPEHPDKNDRCQCGACAGSSTPLPFEMATATTSAAMKTDGLPQSNASSKDATRLLQTAARKISNGPATATNGTLLPARTTARMTARTTAT
jgi:hypothetical protein